jgi:hypothetical protein
MWIQDNWPLSLESPGSITSATDRTSLQISIFRSSKMSGRSSKTSPSARPYSWDKELRRVVKKACLGCRTDLYFRSRASRFSTAPSPVFKYSSWSRSLWITENTLFTALPGVQNSQWVHFHCARESETEILHRYLPKICRVRINWLTLTLLSDVV